MDETAPTRQASRLLAVLAVLLGLLAMHGLASAHHAVATPATGHAAAPGATALTAEGHPDDHGAAAQTIARPGAATLAAPAGASCDDDCPSAAAVLCVAVLTGAALALLLARRRAAPLLPAPAARGGPDAPAPPVRHARGPDPVRELCVSRT